ncbi:pilus assembly protein FimT [Solibacillus sp. R5-41]|uniref:type II secretion system protein n=1 Tax=Solibacillus sp. R5-41 TaxID=2048654 RepID=UPI000C129472|nr:type II secretion system protein [Solibacillus sp. R5-41]ATP41041.1 pilus assembly protein FimT [Solibacillus sp. R5-41]
MNEQGFSFVEALLAVVILFFLSTSLVPLTYHMKQQLELQKRQAHAAEVAFNGALLQQRYGEWNGMQEIEGISYFWDFDTGTVCVTYSVDVEEHQLCV